MTKIDPLILKKNALNLMNTYKITEHYNDGTIICKIYNSDGKIINIKIKITKNSLKIIGFKYPITFELKDPKSKSNLIYLESYVDAIINYYNCRLYEYRQISSKSNNNWNSNGLSNYISDSDVKRIRRSFFTEA